MHVSNVSGYYDSDHSSLEFETMSAISINRCNPVSFKLDYVNKLTIALLNDW